MNPIYRRIINNKINHITYEELKDLARQYRVPVTKTEIKKVLNIIRKEKIDVGNKTQIERLLKKIEREVSPKVKNLLTQLINMAESY